MVVAIDADITVTAVPDPFALDGPAFITHSLLFSNYSLISSDDAILFP